MNLMPPNHATQREQTMASESDQQKIDALRQEHEELVQLYVHEDSMAWQLSLTLLAANGALFTALYGLDVFDPTKHLGIPVFAILSVGIAINVVGYFVLQRSNIHRKSRLFRAYQVEDELGSLGTPIRTFTSAERVIHRNKVLDTHGEREFRERDLHWTETIEALGFSALSNGLAILYYALALWLIVGRPGLR
jgi:hypothetical protein